MAATRPGAAEPFQAMFWNRKTRGSLLAFIGFMLSPLSWWNDLFVNVPLAAGAAWLVTLVYPSAFQVSAVVAYWLTNVLGLVLLHKGAQQALRPEAPRPNRRRELILDVGVSLAYTLLILLLIKQGILQPVSHYFGKGS
jgi:hypothetical protein